jgi:hypothetical protein
MQRERNGDGPRSGDGVAGADGRRQRDLTTEQFHLRSHDHRWSYDVDVTVRRVDGTRVFERRYYLQPGEVISERDVLPSGEYRLSVTLDNDRSGERRCRVGSSPAHTAVIEVGNGVLSVTEGLTG